MLEEYTNPAIAGSIVAVISFLIQIGLFPKNKDIDEKIEKALLTVTTKEDLEKKHREILEEAEQKFVQAKFCTSLHGQLNSQFEDMKQKIDQIYEFLLARK